MGCIFSCLGLSVKSESSSSQSESEMVNATQKNRFKEMSVKMSSPTIQLTTAENNSADDDSGSKENNDNKLRTVTGTGLALAGISIEQDSAYWEWHIEKDTKEPSEGSWDDMEEENEDFFKQDEETYIKFGVATQKDRQFYRIREANNEGDDVPMEDNGTALMNGIPNLKDGDTVGVAVQQSDLPMVQFLVNGEPIHHLAINRFRGTVFPAIWLPPSVKDNESSDKAEAGTNGAYKATIVFDEKKFRELAPHARFGPLIAARGII